MALSPALQQKIAALRAEKAAEQRQEETKDVSSSQQVMASLQSQDYGEILLPSGQEVASASTASATCNTYLKSASVYSNINEGSKREVTPVAPAQLTAADQVLSRIEELRFSLQTQAPGYERLLQTIHSALAKDEEVVHLLTEEQIGIICAGLAKKKNIVLAAATTKSKSESKRLSAVSVDEL